MKTKIALTTLLLAIIAGCIPSLHPLYTETDFIYDPNLLGTWLEGKNSWLFEESDREKAYKLTITTDSKKAELIAHLVKLDSLLFLDLFPVGPEPDISDYIKMHMVPVHTFVIIDQLQPTLKLRTSNPDKLKEMLKKDPNLLKHEILEEPYNYLVVTAPTTDLQTFFRKYAAEPGLFAEPSELKKLSAPDPNASNKSEPNKPGDPNKTSEPNKPAEANKPAFYPTPIEPNKPANSKPAPLPHP